MDRRQALRLLAALGATGVVAACGTDSGTETDEPISDDPVRIGLIAPQTGGSQPIGNEIINGFQLYLELNDQRLGGHPVDLITVDEGETGDSGQAALDALLQRDVLALTGVASSEAMLKIRETVEKAQVPLVGSNASPMSLQSVVYIWRTSYVNDEAGRALGAHVAREVPAGKVGIIAPNHPAAQDAVKGFQKSFGESDRRLLAPIRTNRTGFADTLTKNMFTASITQLLAANPAAIFSPYAGDAATVFIKELRAAGYQKLVYAPGFLTEGKILNELKPAEAEGILTVLNYSADLNNGANRRFASAYRKKHGTAPTTYAMASYDAAQVLDKAIRLAGPQPTPQQVNLALGKVGQIDSPRGPWQFNQPRTPQQRWYLRKVELVGQVLSNVMVSELTTLG